MKKWLSRLFPGLGLLLVVLSLTSTLRPNPEADQEAQALALRQIGHNYLIASGDVSTTIPPVEVLGNNAYLLRLSCNLDYDLLANKTAAVVAQMGIREDYHLTLVDCETGEQFLGSFWANPLSNTPNAQGLEPACLSRDQLPRCTDFRLRFIAPVKTKDTSPKYFFFGVGSLLILSGLLLGRNQPLPKPELPNAFIDKPNDSIQLGVNCTFSPTSQQLTIEGEAQDLTYREAKLLHFFAGHPNEVLQRATIHDAVWGEEGVIVGRSLDVFVSRLRKKLAHVETAEIKTVHGVGYQFLITPLR